MIHMESEIVEKVTTSYLIIASQMSTCVLFMYWWVWLFESIINTVWMNWVLSFSLKYFQKISNRWWKMHKNKNNIQI